MTEHNIWSNLTDKERQDALDSLDSGVSVYEVATNFSLNPESLGRKYRKIKQKRLRNLAKKPTTKSDLTQKKEVRLYHKEHDLWIDNIYGTKDSLATERTMYINTKEPLRFIVYSDTHFSDHDPKACELFLEYVEETEHDFIVHAGDALDCYGLSRYGKDPRKTFVNNIQKELDDWGEFSEQLQQASDKPKYMILGNHMERYYKWLFENPGAFGAKFINLDNIMELKKYGYAPMVNYIMFDCSGNNLYPDPNLVIHHGSVSRKHSGSSARGEAEAFGLVSSISGHVHRLSSQYKRTIRGPIVYAESGTLRTLNPEYMAFPDWQHGCLDVIYDRENSYISINPVLLKM